MCTRLISVIGKPARPSVGSCGRQAAWQAQSVCGFSDRLHVLAAGLLRASAAATMREVFTCAPDNHCWALVNAQLWPRLDNNVWMTIVVA